MVAAASTPPSVTPPRGRTLGDMARSLVVLVVLIFAVGGIVFLRPKPHDPVHVVDTAPTVRQARAAAMYHVLAPSGLSHGWRATSARVGSDPKTGAVHLHLGYVTPDDAYAAVEETGGPAEPFLAGPDVLGPGAQPLSTIIVGPATWQQYRTKDGYAMVRRAGPATYVVTGTSGMRDLVVLAGALR